MKLLIRDYLASLRERDELDAVLPDLLSELGFHVFSRPQRGTVQHGVDIAAVGVDDDGERKVFLFSVKQGDLTRQDWDGSPQALRSSLNAIQDVYIRHRIPTRYNDLKIVICLTFGGDIQEQVRDFVEGYIADHTTERLSFDEWNGDKIAALLLQGILREEILPKPLRSRFQKTVAMADEPEVAYDHFRRLAQALRASGSTSIKARLRAARQLYICVWILFVWARDADNLEAPYRASELALLSGWELLRPAIDSRAKDAKALNVVVMQMIRLHLTIAGEFLVTKIAPHASVLHGISRCFGAPNALDVNLALFEVLGRIGLTGLWAHWLSGRPTCPDPQALLAQSEALTGIGLHLIRNNPTLFLPIADRQATDIALFLQLWLTTQRDAREVSDWLEEMAVRLNFTVRTRGLYPTCATDYGDLVEHPGDVDDAAYFEEATAGSTLIPLLVMWLRALGKSEAVRALATLMQEQLRHCTLQLWTPDAHRKADCTLAKTRGAPLSATFRWARMALSLRKP
ncbi:conserved hypothetical protein [Cupriavidus taiwanensis]|uniref:Chemotaxis protein n=1 Tax=Cupriavidus taiwanensis TaxID=164546 RepID=A0A976B0E1_9BURK|nr:chemotaxis protein [Cupriavidus taiwanensis]SOZ64371.1 conserved hypothetical protein [Cupriavidus taiwanensis]SOZ65079.1 conserved hypothetical protein [Cupriavidus taiwanensis]SOZ68774.1 conserved hypothetical protein [Cupriavidus taiwanensis]SPA08189.1 conserved hypothetical protein [Cupriavidus taiwanensis]